ncbi:MAG: CRISPR-associated endonuclease Cas1 [Candidatus Methanomethylicota archaeon]|uniref:CRISPR-associated endonuclease Cas1 n=1 Tax=Thermoproteota archaeon TaxID=2056631 RepID=A0A523BHB7_9CREN|nr:MAG: CRISPR-associated endonuclease Cas1 [Candidatus Verstraetearchaeota archaeon]
MNKILLIDEWGSFLSVNKGRFILKIKENGKFKIKWEVAPVEVDTIVFIVTGASISAEVIKLASEFGIDLVFLNKTKPLARIIPSNYGSTMKNWEFQLNAFNDINKRVKLAKLFIEGKIHNQRVVLREWFKKLKASGKSDYNLEDEIIRLDEYQSKLKDVNTVEEIMSIEAHAAKRYWMCISRILPKELEFKGRIIHTEGPIDPFNRALNIGYSILKKEVWRAIFLAGLNPYLGFLHSSRAGKMSLVFDVMEEFRPIAVDRPLINLARKDKDVILKLKENKSENLAKIWSTISSVLYSGDKPLCNTIVAQARLLAKHLRGTDEYKPFKAKW